MIRAHKRKNHTLEFDSRTSDALTYAPSPLIRMGASTAKSSGNESRSLQLIILFIDWLIILTPVQASQTAGYLTGAILRRYFGLRIP